MYNDELCLIDKKDGTVYYTDGEIEDFIEPNKSGSSTWCENGACVFLGGCGYVPCIFGCGNIKYNACIPSPTFYEVVVGTSSVCYKKVIVCLAGCFKEMGVSNYTSHSYSYGRCSCTKCGFSGQGAGHSLIPRTYVLGLYSACWETLGECNRCSYRQTNYIERSHKWVSGRCSVCNVRQ